MSPEELERWIVPCSERLGAEPCDAMHFAADVRQKVETMLAEKVEECAKVADNAENLRGGSYGGPASCEYGCGSVIAAAIRRLKE